MKIWFDIWVTSSRQKFFHSSRSFTYRDVIVASVTLTAFRALPVFIPDVVAQGHVAIDLPDAFLLSGAPLGHVVLLLSTLKWYKTMALNHEGLFWLTFKIVTTAYLWPVRCCWPPDYGQTPVVMVPASLDGLQTFSDVVILVVTDITLQANTCQYNISTSYEVWCIAFSEKAFVDEFITVDILSSDLK